ncbi:MFS transporter [Demequina mangrovi]|uniref:MFS transporter, DHA1 family, inner membrane transport protein n=1 Tax=Demequina mangrovi TaxID=1043493 RepID=A0A1H6V6P0_9MICO|nr:MFS transporter [Demequina mangrovi]SEI97487.1 MFS transporter, DHA1 family, inner membrane transport protein [Demequina mangrovi]
MTALPPTSEAGTPRWRMPRTAHAAHPGLVLAGFVVAAFAIGLSQQGAAGVIQDQVRSLDTTVDMIGWTIVAYALGVVVGAPVIMVGLAAWNRRRLLLTMSAVFVVTSALTVVAPSVEALLGIRFLAGLPHGALLGSATYIGVLALGAERRGQAIATLMYGLTGAAVIGVPGMQWLSEQAGWRASYLVVTLVGAAGFVLMWAFVPSAQGTRGVGFRTELAALRGRVLWTAIGTVTVGFAGLGAVQSYIVPLLEDTNGFSSDAVTVILMIFGLGMTAGAFAGGRLTDRSPVLTARIGIIGVAAMLLALGLVGTLGWPVVIALVVLGACIQVFSQSAQAHLMDATHTSPSLGAAIAHSALNAATVVGTGLGAIVIGLGWGFVAPAWVALVLALVAVVLVFVGPGYRR